MAETYVTDVTFTEHNVIRTTVTSSGAAVDAWLDEVLRFHSRRLHGLIVGLDTEWRPNFRPGGDQNPVALIQLCVGRCCLIFQLLHADYIPGALAEFLARCDLRFVGVGISDDADRLRDDHGLAVHNVVDLRDLAAEALQSPQLRQAGLQAVAREVMGVHLEKPRRVTMSRWDARDLSYEQINYACFDAFVSSEVGRRLLPGTS